MTLTAVARRLAALGVGRSFAYERRGLGGGFGQIFPDLSQFFALSEAKLAIGGGKWRPDLHTICIPLASAPRFELCISSITFMISWLLNPSAGRTVIKWASWKRIPERIPDGNWLESAPWFIRVMIHFGGSFRLAVDGWMPFACDLHGLNSSWSFQTDWISEFNW